MKAIIRVAGLFVLVTVGVFATAVQSALAAPGPAEIEREHIPCETVADCGILPIEEAIIDDGADGNGHEDPPAEDEITDGGADGNGHDDPPADDPPADDPPADDPPADDPPTDDPPADDPPADDPPADDPPADDSEECEDCESETQGSTLPKAGTGAAANENDENLGTYALAGLGVFGLAIVLSFIVASRRRSSRTF